MAGKVKSPVSNKKFGTTVLSCVCDHIAQDKLYGAKKRLHNLCHGGVKARCTVCSREKENK